MRADIIRRILQGFLRLLSESVAGPRTEVRGAHPRHPLGSDLAHMCWQKAVYWSLIRRAIASDRCLERSVSLRVCSLTLAVQNFPRLKHVAPRVEYRGLVYPDFGLAALNTNAGTHTVQPSAGLVFRF
jgi:hypothetical protein